MRIHRFILLSVLATPITGFAANGTWSATPANTVFSNSANWVGGVVPGYIGGGSDNNDIATFGTSSTKALTLSQDLWIGGFDITTSGYSFNIGTNNLAMFGNGAGGGGISVSSGTASISLSSPGTFTASAGNYNNLTISPSSASVSFTGNSTGGNNLVISTTGSSTVEFSTSSFTVGTISGFGAYTFSTALTVGGSNASVSVNASATGSGSVTKVGSGTLTLLNTWGHSGGTTISAGSLQLGNNGSTGGLSTSAAVVNNSTLIVNKTSGTTLNGIISGTGNLIKRGSAALTLGGNNTFSGGTTVEAGTLSLSHNSALGTGTVTFAGSGNLQSNSDSRNISNNIVINNGVNLGFGSTNNITLSGNISGAGGISKTNTNTVFLTGTNSYSGGTSISAGTIQVTGSNTSVFTITSSGTLKGNGSVAGITATGGTIIPGTSIGTLTVNGNVNLNSSTTLQIEVSPSSSSLLAATGTATIAGTLNLNYNSGSYTAKDYTILTATSVSGTFSSTNATNAPSDLTASLQYLADRIILKLTSTQPSQTISQRSSGMAQTAAIFLQTVQNGSPTAAQTELYNAVNGVQDQGQINTALNQLYPIVFGNSQSINVNSQQQQQITSRLASLHQSGYIAGDHTVPYGLWIRPFYENGKQNNLKSLLGYKAHTTGLMIGIDRDFTPSTTIGVACSYAYSVVESINYYNTYTNIKTISGILYGSFSFKNNAFIDWLLAGGGNDYHGNRNISVAPVYATAIYDSFAQQYSGQVLLGKDLKYKNSIITPLISANYVYLNQHGYNEYNAGSLGMAVSPYTSSVLTLGGGLKGKLAYQYKQNKFIPEIHALGFYDVKSGTQNFGSTFITGGPALTTNAVPGRITGIVGASMRYYIKNNLDLKIEYDFIGKDKYINNVVYAQLRYLF